jgi:hypothetical protein
LTSHAFLTNVIGARNTKEEHMPAVTPQKNDKVRFMYTVPGTDRPVALDGKVIQVTTNKAVIEVKGTGVVVVPLTDILRVL